MRRRPWHSTPGRWFQATSAPPNAPGRENAVRTIKMLGLAVMAALMAMALVGASSAMAENTSLCTADENPCSAANQVTHVHESTLAGSTNRASLLTNLATIRCQVLFLGDVSGSSLANPLVLSGGFSYSECNFGCTVVEVGGPVTIKVLKTAAELAAVTGEGEVKIDCTLVGIHCTYNGEGLSGHGLGPLTSTEPNGSTSLSEQPTKKVSGSACPETAKLDIVTTPLTATYISS